MGTRARAFSQSLGGGGGGSNLTLADITPFLTTSNVTELSNLYLNNRNLVEALGNGIVLSDISDVSYITGELNQGDTLVWDASNTNWSPGSLTANVNLTTADVPDAPNPFAINGTGSNLYYSNERARWAITPGDNTINYNPFTGVITANVQAVTNAGANTTDGIPEGTQNLYYTDARVHANILNTSIFTLRDVVNTYELSDPFDNDVLIWDSGRNAFIPFPLENLGANTAVTANTVSSLYGFTTNDLAEGSNNFYFTSQRLLDVLANTSIDALLDVQAPIGSNPDGYVLAWNSSSNVWAPLNVGAVGNVGSSVASENANIANVALFAILANAATYATYSTWAAFAENSTTANIALYVDSANTAGYANVAGIALNLQGVAENANLANYANLVISLSNHTTNDLAEGNVNQYYTDAKVYSNVVQMYLDTLYNVSVSSASDGQILTFDGVNWVPGDFVSSAGFAETANVANVANTVVSISDHTTDELPEGSNNVYYTSERVANDVQAAAYAKDFELDDLTLFGDLTVKGNAVLLQVSNVVTESKTITINNGVSAEGAGIIWDGTNASIRYGATNDGLGFDKDITILGNILPAIDSRFNLGSPTKLWRGLYIGARTIYLGGNTLISADPVTGGMVVQDAQGNPASIQLSNITATQYVAINRLLGDANGIIFPEQEFSGYFGGNVNQFTSNVSGNIYFGILKDGDYNKFAGMRVVEVRDPQYDTIRSDLVFYTDHEALNNSKPTLSVTGLGNVEFVGNLLTMNGQNIIDWRGDFIGNAYIGQRDIDITHGGTGANTSQAGRDNLFGDMAGGLVAKIFGANTLAPIAIVGGTGVTVTDGDAQSGNPTIAIGQPVAITDSVQFNNITATGNLTIYGGVTTYGANNVAISDNMVYINHGANVASNPDLGIAWAFDPTGSDYQHGGIFRDATDGAIKFYENYQLEPDANIFIDTDDASFQLANIAVSTVIGNVIGVVSSLSNHTTDNLAEGETNLYFTNARAVVAVTPILTTANVVELDNLYFTNARVLDSLIDATINTDGIIANVITANVINIDSLNISSLSVGNIYSEPRIYGNLYVDESIYANGLILRNIDVTDTLISGNIASPGAGIFNQLVANSITTGELLITANSLTLLSAVTGDSETNVNIIVNRGSNADVSLLWDEVEDRWKFTNEGNIYYNIPVPDEYGNVIYAISAETTDISNSANLKLLGTQKDGNAVVTDQVTFTGTGIASVSRLDKDTIAINAGVAPIVVPGVNSASYTEITRFDINTYRTAKYIYTVTSTAYISGGPEFASGEILLMHDGANVYSSQYGMLLSYDDDEIVNFSATINNSNVILSAQSVHGATIATVKLTGTTYTEI